MAIRYVTNADGKGWPKGILGKFLSSRSPLKLDKAFGILDDMRAFCRSRNVRGHVTLTGGNPLLYPHFLELYQGASDRGFNIAILGNPASRDQIEEILDIKRPTFFQVSLEGLQKHNDTMRGAGHYRMGCKACQPCIIRPVCGGCLAIAHSHGLNIFEDKDPYCFMNMSKTQ